MAENMSSVTLLGIETSCDETAAAVVREDGTILSNIVLSQWREHAPYGGVVPEIAARSHIEHIDAVVKAALAEAGVSLHNLDAIAATGGPGLIGGVIVGAMTGKALASAIGKPFLAINHLEGHALTARLTDGVEFPYLLLLVSGGHCQFLAVEGIGRYHRLGGTLDDALGEAFDKVAKMLGLGMPGGPAVEKLAAQGDAMAYRFAVPLKGREGCDFSFSGLKTAVRQQVDALKAKSGLDATAKADICAAFQRVAMESVVERTRHAIGMFKVKGFAGTLVAAGGVAANEMLRNALQAISEEYGMDFVAPPAALCTDNAAMIAWAGIERFRLGHRDALDFEPRARWPLG